MSDEMLKVPVFIIGQGFQHSFGEYRGLNNEHNAIYAIGVYLSSIGIISWTAGGRVQTQHLGAGEAQSISESYNERDWVTEFTSPQFRELLNYYTGPSGITPQYNGNIASMRWKAASLDSMRYD